MLEMLAEAETGAEVSTTMKTCRKCKAEKDPSAFYKDARFPDGVDIHCAECRKIKVKAWRDANLEKARKVSIDSYAKNPAPNRMRAAAWHLNNRAKARKHALKFRFGITPEHYAAMLKSQDECCGICGAHQSSLKQNLSVDHDHETKHVRGLLCGTCNTGLGHFKDNPKLLENALVYIYEHITRKN